MELGGVDIVLPDGGRECLAVGGFGRNDARIARFGIEAVDEKDVGILFYTTEDWAIGAFDFQLIPTDLRNFEPVTFLEANDAPSK